jgi:hypothetical protein
VNQFPPRFHDCLTIGQYFKLPGLARRYFYFLENRKQVSLDPKWHLKVNSFLVLRERLSVSYIRAHGGFSYVEQCYSFFDCR